MVHQCVTQGTKGSIDNARRPGRGSMMRPTINEESDCLRKKILQRRTKDLTGFAWMLWLGMLSTDGSQCTILWSLDPIMEQGH